MKKLALWLGLVGILGGVLFLAHSKLNTAIRDAQTQCDRFMVLYTPPLPRSGTRYTLFLDAYDPPSKWPGFKPGWIITYKAASGGEVKYFVSLRGDIIHSQPPNWLAGLQKHMGQKSGDLTRENTNRSPLNAAPGPER